MPYNVLVVDDQKVQRKALEAYISEMPDFAVCALLPEAELAVGYCARNKVDLVLMDIVMRDGVNGIDACRKIKEKCSGTKVILVTSMLDASYLSRAKEAAADALWYKEQTDDELKSVCMRVMSGESVYPDCAPEIEMGVARSSEFTKAELDVLHLLVGGDTDQEIADKLYVSVWTVRTHIKDLLQKTGYKNRVELAVKARSSGVVAEY